MTLAVRAAEAVQSFRSRALPPTHDDALIARNSVARADFSSLQHEGALRSADASMPPAFRLALEGALVRAGGPVVDPDGWGVAAIDLMVERP